MPLKLLIADVYSANGRNHITGIGGSYAEAMFGRAVRVHRPDAEIDAVQFDTTTPDMPAPIDAYDGVIWSGSNLTIHRRNPLIDAQIDMARAVFDRGIPQFGVCYGIQLGAVAAGGSVIANPKGMELGWARNVTLNDAGRAHPMYQGKGDHFDALCWHNDTVDQLPQDSTLLASNAMSVVQAAIYRRNGGEFWATQYHLEFNPHEVATLVGGNAGQLVQAGVTDQAGIATLVDEMTELAALEQDPAKAPLALQPVLDPKIRTAELGNWLAMVETTIDR